MVDDAFPAEAQSLRGAHIARRRTRRRNDRHGFRRVLRAGDKRAANRATAAANSLPARADARTRPHSVATTRAPRVRSQLRAPGHQQVMRVGLRPNVRRSQYRSAGSAHAFWRRRSAGAGSTAPTTHAARQNCLRSQARARRVRLTPLRPAAAANATPRPTRRRRARLGRGGSRAATAHVGSGVSCSSAASARSTAAAAAGLAAQLVSIARVLPCAPDLSRSQAG